MAKPDTTSKSPRRSPAKIAQDDLDNTLAKLDAAKVRKEKAQAAVISAETAITALTALSDHQASHPALKAAAAEQDDESLGGTPIDLGEDEPADPPK